MRAGLGAVSAALLVTAFMGCTMAPKAPEAQEDLPSATAPRGPSPAVAASAPAVIAPPVLVPESKASEVDVLLADYERLRRLTPAEIAREQELARQAFIQLKSDGARVRWAMLSSLPGAAATEELRALELLDPLVKSTGSPLHGLAFLLSTSIQEQRRLTALAQGLQQNVLGLQQNNQSLQQNLLSLQQKLDALRTLERSLTERGESAPRRR